VLTSAVDNLLLDLLECVDMKERSYQDALGAWRSLQENFSSHWRVP
jgi:hypothetical protein